MDRLIAPADLPYILMMLMLVAEQSLASGDEGQQTVTAQKKGSSEQIEVYNLIVLSPEPSLTLQGHFRDLPDALPILAGFGRLSSHRLCSSAAEPLAILNLIK